MATTTTTIVCPHCGKRFVYAGEVERHDVNGAEAYFLPLRDPNAERHIDQRICCPRCYAAHGTTYARGPVAAAANPKDPPHPFGTRYHSEVRLAKAVGNK